MVILSPQGVRIFADMTKGEILLRAMRSCRPRITIYKGGARYGCAFAEDDRIGKLRLRWG